jgi:hypothetical protein
MFFTGSFWISGLIFCVLCALYGESIFPPFPEEAPQKLPALCLQYSRSHFNPMIEPAVFQQRIKGADSPSLGVFIPEDKAPDSRLKNGPRAHNAGFEGHV